MDFKDKRRQREAEDQEEARATARPQPQIVDQDVFLFLMLVDGEAASWASHISAEEAVRSDPALAKLGTVTAIPLHTATLEQLQKVLAIVQFQQIVQMIGQSLMKVQPAGAMPRRLQ